MSLIQCFDAVYWVTVNALGLSKSIAPTSPDVFLLLTKTRATSSPKDSIWAMMIVPSLGGNIIRTVLCCVVYNGCAQWYEHTCEQFLNLRVCLGLEFAFVCLFRFSILCVYCVSLGHFIPVLLAFVVLGLVCSVPSQEIGWEQRLWNYLFYVVWDVKP